MRFLLIYLLGAIFSLNICAEVIQCSRNFGDCEPNDLPELDQDIYTVKRYNFKDFKYEKCEVGLNSVTNETLSIKKDKIVESVNEIKTLCNGYRGGLNIVEGFKIVYKCLQNIE
jgi:hypothetical protein